MKIAFRTNCWKMKEKLKAFEVFENQRKKYYGFVGGQIHQPAEGRVVFWLDRIRHCVDRLLAMDIYRFGDGFVQQETGIPIGGPISGVVLDIVCSVLEYLFDKRWETLADACKLKGKR